MKAISRLVLFVAALWAAGFVWFISSIEREEQAAKALALLQNLPEIDRETTGIVALTGGGGRRIEVALALLSQHTGKRVLVSGVSPGTRNADLISITPSVDPSLYECCVDLGDKAHTTLENAVEAQAWAIEHDYTRLVLVTTDYHMARAMAEMKMRMPSVEFIAYPVPSKTVPDKGWMKSPDAWRVLAIEYSKFLVAKLRMLVDGRA